MIHTGVFNGEVRRLSLISVSCPKKLFEPQQCLLDFRHAIPLLNYQPKLACPVGDHVGDVNCLKLGVSRTGDVRKLREFLDCRYYGCKWVARVAMRLLDYVLPYQKLVHHEMTLVCLKVCKYIIHGVVNRVHCPVADIC